MSGNENDVHMDSDTDSHSSDSAGPTSDSASPTSDFLNPISESNGYSSDSSFYETASDDDDDENPIGPSGLHLYPYINRHPIKAQLQSGYAQAVVRYGKYCENVYELYFKLNPN